MQDLITLRGKNNNFVYIVNIKRSKNSLINLLFEDRYCEIWCHHLCLIGSSIRSDNYSDSC